MSEKKLTISPNEQLIIELARKNRRVNIPPQKGKGLIAASRRDSYLPRRKKASGRISFYDLGQKRNEEGDWITNEFLYTPTLDWTVIDSAQVNIESLPAAAVAAFESSLLAVGEVNLKTTYRKITNAAAPQFPLHIIGETYTFDLPETPNDTWNENGLKVSGSEAAGLLSLTTPLIYPIYAPFTVPIANLKDGANIKVTRTLDFSAAAAAFTPKPNANWFLMPRVTIRTGLSQESGEVSYHLNLDYKIRKRYFDEPSAAADGGGGAPSAEPRTRMLADLPFRAFKTDTTTHSVVGSLTFPYISDDNTFIRYGTDPATTSLSYSDYLGYTHALAAVVEQSDGFFYIWKV